MIITIVAFRDDRPRSVSYRKFDTDKNPGAAIEKAIEFYKDMLGTRGVRVISTRIVVKKR